MLKALIETRQRYAALRYGRYYFRRVSGDGQTFGHSMDVGGVFAVSRIHADQEVLIVTYPNPFQPWSGFVEIDADLCPAGATWNVAFSTLGRSGSANAVSPGGTAYDRAIAVHLESNELQILVRA